MARVYLSHLFLALVALPQMTQQNSTVFLKNKLLPVLLDTYSLYQIPQNGSNPLLVNVNVIVCNVLNVDILSYTLSVVLLLNQSWYNKELAWNEEDFPFTTMNVPWSSVWTPALNVQEAHEVIWKMELPDVVLHSDGKVEFPLALRIDSNCNFDLHYYPIDSFNCTLSFFPPTNKVSEIEFEVSIKNDVLSAKRDYLVTGLNIRTQNKMEQPYFIVKVTLANTGIRIILSTIVPSTALLATDLCGFLVPLKDRLSYMITLLLAYLVFYSSLVGSLPGASSCSPLLNIKEESSHLTPASHALDRFFFFIYLGLVLMFHVVFLAVWIFWKCQSEKPPGEEHLDGIKW